MTKYLNDGAFTVGMPTGQRFRDNWDRIFGKKRDEASENEDKAAPDSAEEPKKDA